MELINLVLHLSNAKHVFFCYASALVPLYMATYIVSE